jgi:geranylgeranyl diphosphate synthase type II
MHARKTGALIRASAAAGAVMGGARDDQVDAIDRAAAEFGLAFQIIDDVLDVEAPRLILARPRARTRLPASRRIPRSTAQSSRGDGGDCLARAAATLQRVDLADSRLLQIGRWIVERSN